VEIPSWVKIGNGYKIDENVMIGYKSGRNIKSLETIIGKNAIIRAGTVIYASCKIGNNLETGHNVIIREENEIGDSFNIWNNSIIDYGCKIGNNVKVHSNCYIAQFTVIEDEVFLAPGVIIANDIHPYCKFYRECMKGPTIKKGAKIGCNSTILPFLTIGEKSLIGAGSVVTKDVPPETVAYGNPAKVVKSIYDLECVTGLTDKPYKIME